MSGEQATEQRPSFYEGRVKPGIEYVRNNWKVIGLGAAAIGAAAFTLVTAPGAAAIGLIANTLPFLEPIAGLIAAAGAAVATTLVLLGSNRIYDKVSKGDYKTLPQNEDPNSDGKQENNDPNPDDNQENNDPNPDDNQENNDSSPEDFDVKPHAGDSPLASPNVSDDENVSDDGKQLNI